MSSLSRLQRSAVEGVAKRFSAAWEAAAGESPDAWLVVDGKRIALEVAALTPMSAPHRVNAKPRLRFDKVAVRFVRSLQTSLAAFVPDGEVVMITVTAPILLASKTAAALESRVRDYLARRPAQLRLDETIHGNRLRARLIRNVPAPASKVIGFVHNPEPEPEGLFDLAQSQLAAIGAAAGRPPPAGFAGDRWLVIVDADGFSDIGLHRQVYSQLSPSTAFKKIVMLLAGGRVDVLAE